MTMLRYIINILLLKLLLNLRETLFIYIFLLSINQILTKNLIKLFISQSYYFLRVLRRLLYVDVYINITMIYKSCLRLLIIFILMNLFGGIQNLVLLKHRIVRVTWLHLVSKRVYVRSRTLAIHVTICL